ncbi:MAG: SBBP repeat-containing protein [Blastocatellia bacterium]
MSNPFRRVAITLAAIIILFSQLSVPTRTTLARSSDNPAPLRTADPATTNRVQESYGKLPLGFETNEGQFDPRVKFVSRGGGYSLSFTQTEMAMRLRNAGSGAYFDLRMEFRNANRQPRIEGADPLPGRSNYLIGADRSQWRTDVANYAKVRYRELYRGIDLVFYGNQRQFEYDFIVKPGADPSEIDLSFHGIEKVRIDANGDLVCRNAGVELRQQKPLVYQDVAGKRRIVASRYVMRGGRGGREVGFEVADYDRSQPLVIDPTLVYSTGGIGGFGIAVDSGGNVYVIGTTTANDFPVTNPLQAQLGGGLDVFVAKLNAEGTALVYSTYLGGIGSDQGARIAVDAAGNVYLTGSTESPDFPGASNGFGNRAFFKSGDGGGNWAGNHSGLPYVETYALAVNPQNPSIIYIATGGSRRVFKSTDGGSNWAAADAGLTGVVRALVVDPVNPSVLYASVDGPAIFKTTDGGANWTSLNAGLPPNLLYPASLAITPSRPATLYAASSFPIIYKSTNGGADWTAINTNLFDSNGNVRSLAVDPANPDVVYAGDLASVYKSVNGGLTWSRASNGLTGGANSQVIDPANPSVLYAGGSQGVFKSTDGGGSWAAASAGLPTPSPFVNPLIIDPVNRLTLYAVILSGPDRGIFRTTDGGGAWTAVSKGLPAGDVSALAIDPRNPATVYSSMRFTGSDAFVAKLNANGSAIVYSRYLGGIGNDMGADVAVNPMGEAYVAGTTISENFPVTPNAKQAALAGNPRVSSDAFVTKLTATGSIEYSTFLGGAGADTAAAITLFTDRALVTGSTKSSDFPTGNSVGFDSALGSENGAAFLAMYNTQFGADALILSAYLNRENGSAGRDVAVDQAGNIYLLTAPILDLAGFPGLSKGSGLGIVTKFAPLGLTFGYRKSYSVQFGSIYREPVRSNFGGFMDHPDQFNSLAVDAAGNVYLTGTTHIGANFPTTPGAFQPVHGNTTDCYRFSPSQPSFCHDAFVMKLNAAGTAVVYSSFIGGGTQDVGGDITVDAAGNAYVTGGSRVLAPGGVSNFPSTPGALPTASNRGFTARIAADNRSTAFGSSSAASYIRPPLAPESIVAGFGSGLAASTMAATTTPLPTKLGNTQVVVKDSAGTERAAPLFFVSPAQINYQAPEGMALGPATVVVKNGDLIVATEQLEIANVSPGLFTANASGQGLPAAFAQRLRNNTTIAYEPVARFDAAQNRFEPVPIDLGPAGDEVYLVLYGTGFRRRGALSAVSVKIGGLDMTINYAGPQLQLVGLDQINVFLPRTLAGRGEVDVVVTVDGKPANTVRVNIK